MYESVREIKQQAVWTVLPYHGNVFQSVLEKDMLESGQ